LEEQRRKYERTIAIAERIAAQEAIRLVPEGTGDAQARRQAKGKELAADLAGGLRQKVTEVEGELALTAHMLKQGPEYRLARGFEGETATGFDQVWIKSDGGQDTEVVIAEAKGPGATLGNPAKGPQMSSQWTMATILDMVKSGDPMGKQLLQAAIKGSPPIRGLVVEAARNPGDPPIDRTGEVRPGGEDPRHWKLLNPTMLDNPRIRERLKYLLGDADPQIRAQAQTLLDLADGVSR
ncbi:MAG: hypothetical protein H6R22_1277, partial [Chromatiaceae bacterium]|nr:hypothetical protein [Chromatiaceae bacterium]